MKGQIVPAILAITCTAFAAGAQTAFTNLDEIVVTPLRTPSARVATASSVTVVTEEEISGAGDIALADYLARLPGISVTRNGPPGASTALSIRGAAPRYVAVYVDGIRVDDPTGIATAFDFGPWTTADIGRIEVLRGSQSALWGGSAVGGIISITSREAEDDGLHQSVRAEAGSHGTARLQYGAAWRDERVEATFSLSRTHTDGFSAFDTRPRDRSLERDGFDATRLSFSAKYHESDTLTLGIAAFGQRSYGDYDDFGADSPVPWQKRREYGLRAFGEYADETSTHRLELTRYRIHRLDHASFGDSTFVGRREGIGYQGTTRVSPAFTLVYGADTMDERAVTEALATGRSINTTGVFAEGLVAAGDALDLSLGLRRDHASSFGNHTSGRLALAYRAAPDLSLRAAAATGFRAPSLYELSGDPTWGIAPNAALAPETSRSLEFGVDYEPGADFRLSATLFNLRIRDAITYCGAFADPCVTPLPPGGATNLYENVAGHSTRRGIELSAEMNLGTTAVLGMNYTYTEARAPTGGRIAGVPRHNAVLSLAGDLAPRLRANAALQHVAGRPGADYRDYTLVHAGLSYDLTDAAQFTLNVHNLFDRDYQVIPDYGTSGRSILAGISTRF